LKARQWLVRLFAFDPGAGLSLRLYHLSTLLGAAVCLLLLVPGNVLLGLTPLLTGLAAAFGLSCILLYVLSLRGRYLPGTFCALLTALLNAAWFLGGGSQGSAVMWFYLAAIVLTVFLRGRARVLALILFVADGLLLYGIEARYPWRVPYDSSAGERLVDLVSGFALSMVACVLLVSGVLAAYHDEQRRLQAANLALERSLAEVKALRELLPVCAWCQRIRDDAGQWQPVERYVERRRSVTHGICPDCLEKHFDMGGASPPQ
jgi:hypothetical protein